jgi:hypothetical protein
MSRRTPIADAIPATAALRLPTYVAEDFENVREIGVNCYCRIIQPRRRGGDVSPGAEALDKSEKLN